MGKRVLWGFVIKMRSNGVPRGQQVAGLIPSSGSDLLIKLSFRSIFYKSFHNLAVVKNCRRVTIAHCTMVGRGRTVVYYIPEPPKTEYGCPSGEGIKKRSHVYVTPPMEERRKKEMIQRLGDFTSSPV